MKFFNCIWLEANHEHSDEFSFDGLAEVFGEMEVSFVEWNSDGGDFCFEIDIADQSIIDSVCSVLVEHKVISLEESKEIIDAKVDVITLY